MNPEQRTFLSLVQLPGRLTVQQAAFYLGFSETDIMVLVEAGLLRPLGTPPRNGVKYFSAAVLEQFRGDQKFLSRASDAIYRHWRVKNSRKRFNAGDAVRIANMFPPAQI